MEPKQVDEMLNQFLNDFWGDTPVDEQQNILNTIRFKNYGKALDSIPTILKDLSGSWSDVHVSNEDIEEIRRESLRNFPSEDV